MGDRRWCRASFLGLRRSSLLLKVAPDRLGSIVSSNFARARLVEETLAPKWPFWQTGRVFLTCKRCWQHPISNCALSHGVPVCKVLLDLVSITSVKTRNPNRRGSCCCALTQELISLAFFGIDARWKALFYGHFYRV